MRFQSFWRFPLIIVVILCFTIFLFPAEHSYAFSDQVMQRGATGEDVIELQARLQYNGYYHGPIDGVFGWSTYWSVRNFQKEFGLETVDGFVGQKTKDMLIRATKYYKDYVYQQINQGRRFTHYGGMPLKIQSAPSQATITKARKAAEQKRQTALNIAQKPGTQAPAGQQAQKPGAQTPAKQQAQKPATQTPAGQQAQKPAAQAPAGQQAQKPGTQVPAGQQAQKPATQVPAQQQAQKPAAPAPAGQKAQKPASQAPAVQKEAPAKQQNATQAPKATAVNMPNGFSQNDIQLLANAVYGEARGEPYIGQVAIAAVILNRINSPSFPDTVSGVIFEPGAFTAVADGQIWLTPNDQAKKAVLDAINGFDPTGEAMYYFNPATATNKWIWSRPQIKRIGKHIFCK